MIADHPDSPTVRSVLARLSSGVTASPRLVHRGDDARIELSGRVLLNWTAKAANLLLEEADVRPGDVVALDLPPGHWRSAYWALAAWSLGACVDVTPGGGAGAVVRIAVASPDLSADPPTVAVTPAPLARRSEVALAPGVIDEAAVLSTYGDVAPPAEDVEPDEAALLAGSQSWSFAELCPPAEGPSAGEGATGQERRILLAPHGRPTPAGALRAMVGAWAADGSLVVPPAGVDPDALARIAEQEGVTRRVTG
ncbi:TIGR03089 family protein [Agilicoccus flavus]|uniref:TIGR03089 family protein n=1 Tax=Agilicoccus flavus TaxID=2775968 RepID=UPI001CF67F84|nr:TIGR03089 family protein [Agilicoccus flavus]